MVVDELIYDGYLKVIRRKIGNIEREIIHQEPAVAVAVVNEKETKMLLVRQYRASIFGDTWEIPAGMMDVPGESLKECMVRELEEEANLQIDVDDLGYEGSYNPNIGISDQKIHLFSLVADELEESYRVDDSDVEEVKWFTTEEIQNMINIGEIVDGKTILLFYKLF